MSDPTITFHAPFAEQIDFFRQKLNLPSERWDDIIKSAHDRAFIVAGAMKADLLDDLRTAIDKAIAEGRGINEFRKDFKTLVAKQGWSGWTGEGTPAGEAWRTRVIYQTNMSTSYAAGRYQQLTDQGLLAIRPYWQYIHADGVQHPRPLHLRWHKLTLPHDHVFWKTHYPPNGWGCQCRVKAVAKPNLADGDVTELPEGWNERDAKGNLPGIDKGFDYAPGANVKRTFKDLIDQKLIKLDAPIGALLWERLKPVLAMERQMSWWETLDEWRSSGQIGAVRTQIIGALTPETLSWLKTERSIVPLSAEIAIQDRLVLGPKERRHQEKSRDGLTEAEWRQLPALLESPERILFDERSGHLLFVLPVSDAASQKITVEFDYRSSKKSEARINMVVSAYRQKSADIAGEIKGGIWTETR